MTIDGSDAMELCRSCRHIRRTRCDLGLATGSAVTDSTICGMYNSPQFLQDSGPGLRGKVGDNEHGEN